MSRRSWLCWLLLLAAGDIRCAAKRFGVDTYLHSLELEVTLDRDRAQVGEEIIARCILRNRGPGSVEGCLGEAKGYNMLGTKDARGSVQTIDHPGCVRRFKLEPAQTVEWNEPIQVIDVGVGPVQANLWAQVTDPTECDRYGCDAINLKSGRLTFEIVPTRGKVDVPSNNRLKLPARGRSAADARWRTRAAA
jgi:hypothetical protein